MMKRAVKVMGFVIICTLLLGTVTPVAASSGNIKESQILIIGDSRTESLKQSGVISKSQIVSFIGAKAGSMWNNKKCNKAIKSKGKNAKKVYIALGINDLAKKSSKKTANHVIRFIEKVHKYCPKAEIIVQNIIPVKGTYRSSYCTIRNASVSSANKRIKSYASKTEYVSYYHVKTKIRYSDDKLHFQKSTYRSIAKELKTLLLKKSPAQN